MNKRAFFKKLTKRRIDKLIRLEIVGKEIDDDISVELKEKIHREIDKIFNTNNERKLLK